MIMLMLFITVIGSWYVAAQVAQIA
jgi:hypothetical protein